MCDCFQLPRHVGSRNLSSKGIQPAITLTNKQTNPQSSPTVSESGSTMAVLLLRYSTLKLIILDGKKFVRTAPPKLLDVDGPEAEASSSMDVGLLRSSIGRTSDSLECPMVAVAIRAGPISVGEASCITEFTANCGDTQSFS